MAKDKSTKEPGRLKQMWQVFQMTRRYDNRAVLYIVLGLALPILAGILLAVFLSGGNVFTVVLWVLAGVLGGVLAALIILGRRAERAAYSQIEGQPGAVGAVLRSSLKRSWRGSEMPVAVNGKTQDAVYRATGRGGVVLISEGPKTRTQRMLDEERRKVTACCRTCPSRHLGRPGRRLHRAAQDPAHARQDQADPDQGRGPRDQQPPPVAGERDADPEGHRPA